jgi:hypothetical protein
METDLIKYIYEKMLAEAKNYQWKMIFDRHKHALEIYFTISLELNKEQYVQDINGNVNDSNLLQFEEVVCFYDINEQRVLPENYVYAVPFNPDTGIEQGEVDAFLKQLNIQISHARNQLREFLLDEGQEVFTMEWNEKNMDNTLATMRETNRYSTNLLTFLRENQSIVNQFKEEQHDGLERI